MGHNQSHVKKKHIFNTVMESNPLSLILSKCSHGQGNYYSLIFISIVRKRLDCQGVGKELPK